jgi:hypothetical protein
MKQELESTNTKTCHPKDAQAPKDVPRPVDKNVKHLDPKAKIHEDHLDKCDGSDPNSDSLAKDALEIISHK